MGLIVKPVEIVGNKGRAKVRALFDTGASSSFLRKDIAERVATFGPLPNPRKFLLGDGKNAILAQEFAAVDIIIKGVTVFFPLWVVEQIGEEIIIGADMLQRWKIRLDPETEDVFIDPKVTELKLMTCS